LPDIFNALPGLDVSVDAISKDLAKMWSDTAAAGRAAPASEDAKATQVNFVLHLGFNTTAEDAVAQFRTVVAFSRRYPSRVVVLCPLQDDAGQDDIRAKIYGECHLGKSKGDTRCVEFVMLSYPREARVHLENQVSICLSTDLPLYYWAHRFSESARLADYHYLLTRSKRVLIDSAVAPADALSYPWPRPEIVRDLVYARLLPVRQTIGQFLASYPPAALVSGLKTVTTSHAAELSAEGRVLLGWLRQRLEECGAKNQTVAYKTAALPLGAKGSLAVRFEYETESRFFRWSGDLATGQALFEVDVGTGKTTLAAAVSLLAPENALSEAMFF
jgi:glucose-6-phosphate dehydrogenase assembly protein OpcA